MAILPETLYGHCVITLEIIVGLFGLAAILTATVHHFIRSKSLGHFQAVSGPPEGCLQ